MPKTTAKRGLIWPKGTTFVSYFTVTFGQNGLFLPKLTLFVLSVFGQNYQNPLCIILVSNFWPKPKFCPFWLITTYHSLSVPWGTSFHIHCGRHICEWSLSARRLLLPLAQPTLALAAVPVSVAVPPVSLAVLAAAAAAAIVVVVLVLPPPLLLLATSL